VLVDTKVASGDSNDFKPESPETSAVTGKPGQASAVKGQ